MGRCASAASTADAGKVQAVWSKQERAAYLVSAGIVSLPGEEGVLRFLGDAMAGVPLPSPWVMLRDRQRHTYFANQVTGISSWKHPLEPSLRELAHVCRECLELPRLRREAAISALRKRWELEAKGEYAKWYPVKLSCGREYFRHRETGAAMWDHPAQVLLPAHYMKIRSIERLRHDDDLAQIGRGARADGSPAGRARPSATAAAPTSPRRGSVAAMLKAVVMLPLNSTIRLLGSVLWLFWPVLRPFCIVLRPLESLVWPFGPAFGPIGSIFEPLGLSFRPAAAPWEAAAPEAASAGANAPLKCGGGTCGTSRQEPGGGGGGQLREASASRRAEEERPHAPPEGDKLEVLLDLLPEDGSDCDRPKERQARLPPRKWGREGEFACFIGECTDHSVVKPLLPNCVEEAYDDSDGCWGAPGDSRIEAVDMLEQWYAEP